MKALVAAEAFKTSDYVAMVEELAPESSPSRSRAASPRPPLPSLER